MMVKCECGGELLWLFINKGPGLFPDPDRFVQTDHAICNDCDKVYLQIIHSTVEWREIRPSDTTARKKE